MGLILLITGIFGGLFLFIATIYSLAQAMLSEGWVQRAHLAALVATLLVMAALYEREVLLARALALPLLGLAVWTFWLEERWYKVFPLMTQGFAVILIAGYVAL